MGRGDADSYVEAITASVDNIAKSCREPALRKAILNNVANTMTDRHKINMCASRRLEDEVQNEQLNNFYCGMHPLWSQLPQ